MRKLSAIKLLCSALMLCSLSFSIGQAHEGTNAPVASSVTTPDPNMGTMGTSNGLFQVSFNDNLFCNGQSLMISVSASLFAPSGSLYTFQTRLEDQNGNVVQNLSPVTTPTVPFTYAFPLNPPSNMGGMFRVRVTGSLAVGMTGPVLDLGSLIDFVTVNRPPVLSIDFTGYTASCNSTIKVSASAGSGEYQYSLDGYNFFPQTYTSGGYTFSNLPSGYYLARVRDSKGCTNLANTQISPIHSTPSLSVTQITDQSAILKIGPVTGNTVYDVRYRTVLGGTGYTSSNVEWNVMSDLTFQTLPPNEYLLPIEGLQGCTKYEVQVRAKCGPGFSEIPWDVEHAKFFTTVCQGGVVNCPTPQTVYVANNTVWWEASDDVVCYTVSMGPVNTPATSWAQYVINHNPFAPSVGQPAPLDLQYFAFPPGLQPNTQYNVRVRGNCTYCSNLVGTFSPWSGMVRFRTRAAKADGTIEIADAQKVNDLVSVYPNPSKGAFTLTVTAENAGVGTLRITDILGQTVLEKNLRADQGTNDYSIDLTGQPAGIYLLNYTIGTTSQTMKIIVK